MATLIDRMHRVLITCVTRQCTARSWVVAESSPVESTISGEYHQYFSNISAKVQARLVKPATLIESRTLCRVRSTDARYYFRFRHRAPLKIFSYVLYRVVPRFKGHVTPYKMAWHTGDYRWQFGGQGPKKSKITSGDRNFFRSSNWRLTSINARKRYLLASQEFLKAFKAFSRNWGLKIFGPTPFFRVRPLSAPLGGGFLGALVEPPECY